MSLKLNLFYEGQLVGVLTEDEQERLSFQYSKNWLESEYSFSLSLALKLSDRVFDHLETKSFFENLLPEGEVKATLEKVSQKNISDEFHFLKEYGVDCAGAFMVTEADSPERIEKFQSKEVKLNLVYKYLREKRPLTSTMITEEGGRFSLAGAQDKFPVIYKKKKLYLPLNGEPTTHILKPYIRYHKGTEDTPYNEYFCMDLAKAIGLNVPEVEILEGEFPLYLVKRFDRKAIDGETKRIHQQDFCQAQGLTSRKKYEADGGPTLAINFELIKKESSLPIKDLSQYLQWMWFNLFIGNNDCHSKNISFLHTDKGLRLAPFYDLMCTSIYSGLSPQFSYRIGGQWLWHKLKSKHLEILSGEMGIQSKLLLGEGTKVMETLNTKLDEKVDNFNKKFERIKTADSIAQETHKRMGHIKKNTF